MRGSSHQASHAGLSPIGLDPGYTVGEVRLVKSSYGKATASFWPEPTPGLKGTRHSCCVLGKRTRAEQRAESLEIAHA